MRFWAMLFVVLAFPFDIFAATPVDIYQDMESGKDGDLLTPAIMNAASHSAGSTWSLAGSMWVSQDKSRNLPGPVIVGGITYPGTSATRTWKFNDGSAKNFVRVTLASSYPRITVACYYTPGVTVRFWNQFDTIIMSGNRGFAVLQTTKEDVKGPYIRAHSCTAGWKTTFSPDHIAVVSGKTYWINLHFDGSAGKTSVAVFDPDKAFAQVGTTVVADSVPDSTMKGGINFGRGDNHRDNRDAKTQSCFGQILVDYSNGAFPLIPSAAGK
jgi:hypothetical protein